MSAQRLFAEEFRAEVTEQRMSGHASVFGSVARIGSGYETIDKRAFDRPLKDGADVRLLFNHDPSQLLGRTKSGTLELRSDGRGLAVTADLPDTPLGHTVRTLIQRGDLDAMSFGFKVTKDSYSVAPDGRQMRTIEDLELFDVSLATFPAYKDAADVVLRTVDFSTTSPVTGREQLIRIRARASASLLTRKAAG